MKHFNKIGIQVAITSFGLGTLLLIIYAITHLIEIAIIGYYYLIVTLFINSILALVFLILTIIFKSERIKNLKTIDVMLLNIPIAFLYVIIVFDYLKI